MTAPARRRDQRRANWPAITSMITASTAVGALVFTGLSLNATQEQVAIAQAQNKVAEQGQITDRYTKAVEQLDRAGADHLQARLGAIYSLERLARDSPRDQPTIIEVLSAFIRASTPRIGGCPSQPVDFDVTAAAIVLGRRDVSHDNNTAIDLRNACLHNAQIGDANLAGANLEHADLSGANLDRADLRNAKLGNANMRNAALGGYREYGANDAPLRDADLRGADLRGADLRNADMHGGMLYRTDLRDADLWGADLGGAELGFANLSGQYLLSTVLTGSELQDANLRDVHLGSNGFEVTRNADGTVTRLPFPGADLRNVHLSGADLSRAKVDYANLSGVNLEGTRLNGTDLSHADLRGTNLIGAGHDVHTTVATSITDQGTRGQWW